MIDTEARAVFVIGVTTEMIKSMSGYNHCDKRNKMINREAISTKYLWYINKEDWEYILLYIANEERNEEFIFQLREKVIQIEGTKEIIHEVLQFIENIKTYL